MLGRGLAYQIIDKNFKIRGKKGNEEIYCCSSQSIFEVFD
jgi:hypothetical protein